MTGSKRLERSKELGATTKDPAEHFVGTNKSAESTNGFGGFTGRQSGYAMRWSLDRTLALYPGRRFTYSTTTFMSSGRRKIPCASCSEEGQPGLESTAGHALCIGGVRQDPCSRCLRLGQRHHCSQGCEDQRPLGILLGVKWTRLSQRQIADRRDPHGQTLQGRRQER